MSEPIDEELSDRLAPYMLPRRSETPAPPMPGAPCDQFDGAVCPPDGCEYGCAAEPQVDLDGRPITPTPAPQPPDERRDPYDELLTAARRGCYCENTRKPCPDHTMFADGLEAGLAAASAAHCRTSQAAVSHLRLDHCSRCRGGFLMAEPEPDAGGWIDVPEHLRKLHDEKAALIARLTEIHGEIDAYRFLQPQNHVTGPKAIDLMRDRYRANDTPPTSETENRND